MISAQQLHPGLNLLARFTTKLRHTPAPTRKEAEAIAAPIAEQCRVASAYIIEDELKAQGIEVPPEHLAKLVDWLGVVTLDKLSNLLARHY